MKRIICKVTGRSWSSESAFLLTVCTQCERKIDKSVESWYERAGVGRYCEACVQR